MSSLRCCRCVACVRREVEGLGACCFICHTVKESAGAAAAPVRAVGLARPHPGYLSGGLSPLASVVCVASRRNFNWRLRPASAVLPDQKPPVMKCFFTSIHQHRGPFHFCLRVCEDYELLSVYNFCILQVICWVRVPQGLNPCFKQITPLDSYSSSGSQDRAVQRQGLRTTFPWTSKNHLAQIEEDARSPPCLLRSQKVLFGEFWSFLFSVVRNVSFNRPYYFVQDCGTSSRKQRTVPVSESRTSP